MSVVINNPGGGSSAAAVTTPWQPTWNFNATTPAAQTANAILLTPFNMPYTMQVTSISVRVSLNGAGVTDVGIYNTSGTLLGHIGGQTNPATGVLTVAINGGAITLSPGTYLFAITDSTGNNRLDETDGASVGMKYTTTTTATSGVLPGSISVAAVIFTTSQKYWAFTLS